jgi:hypothetical protein
VGVLKFRIQKGSREPTDNAGTLNLDLARRLTVALILADDVRDPLNIIEDASAVAARLNNASYLTAAGRKKLFEQLYPLA